MKKDSPIFPRSLSAGQLGRPPQKPQTFSRGPRELDSLLQVRPLDAQPVGAAKAAPGGSVQPLISHTSLKPATPPRRLGGDAAKRPTLVRRRAPMLERRQGSPFLRGRLTNVAHPNGLVPLHQPLGDPYSHMTPQEHAAHKNTRHLSPLTDTAKNWTYSGWGGEQLGRLGFNLAESGLDALGEVAFPFAILAACSAMYDSYATGTDARKAKDDYLFAITALCQQESALNEAQARTEPPADAALIKLLTANIAVLKSFTTSYEAAYYPKGLKPYLDAARNEIGALAQELAQLSEALADLPAAPDASARIESIESIESGGFDLPPPELPSHATTDWTDSPLRVAPDRAEITQRIEKVKGRMVELLSRDRLKQAATTELAEARQELHRAKEEGADEHVVAALEQRVALAKEHVAAFSVSAQQILFHPFKDLGHSDLKFVRDVYLQIPKTGVDLSASSLVFLTAIDVGGFFLQTAGLGFVSGALGAYMARLDIKDGKQEQSKASAAKLALFRQAATAAQVYQALAKLPGKQQTSQTRQAQFLAWTRMRSLARALRVAHRATNHGQLRVFKGSAVSLNTGLIATLGSIGIALLNPYVAIPAAVVGAGAGATWVTSVGIRSGQRKKAKDKLKERTVVGREFVRRYGIRGVDKFTGASTRHKIDDWQMPLVELRDAALKAPGNKVNWAKLDLDRLLENGTLAAEFVTQALQEHVRNGDPAAPCWQLDLLRDLGMDTGLLEPLLKPDSPLWMGARARHKEQLRLIVGDFFGVRPFGEEQLPIAPEDTAELTLRTANIVNRWATSLKTKEEDADASSTSLQLIDDLLNTLKQEPRALDAWIETHGKGDDLRKVRAGLAHLRELLGQERIGPEELWRVQPVLGDPEQNGVIVAGLLSEPVKAAMLLELLADPSWLNPSPVLPPIALERNSGPQAIEYLLKAIKTVGREMRDGAPLGQARARDAKPPNRDMATSARVGQAARRISRTLGMQGARMGKHLVQRTPNPLGTPERALQRLRAAPPGDDRNQIHFDVLRGLLRAAGGDTLTLPTDPAAMATLNADASNYEVGRAHIKALLDDAKASAQAVVDTIDAGHGTHLKESASMDRLKARMEAVAALCDHLIESLNGPAARQVFLNVNLK